MKHTLALLLILACLPAMAQKKSYVEKVNPFIGATTAADRTGNGLGKTYPGATTPFGMVQVSPQTITGGDNGSGYSYEHTTIEGFSMTQMSGVGWYGDLGNFTVMPTTGTLHTVAGKEDGSITGWRSHYDKTTETARAGYYSVRLSDYDILAECSATPRCGILRFTFPESDTSRIQIDLARRVGGTSVLQNVKVVGPNAIEGWIRCTPDGGGWGDGGGNANYTVYFHAEFNKDLERYGFWKADIRTGESRHLGDVTSNTYLQRVARSEIIRDRKELTGKHIGFFTEFPTRKGEQVELKVGISFVDIEGARKNFSAEIAGKDFDAVARTTAEQWNKELSRIDIEGGSDEEQTIFYTALYHTMLDPRIYEDIDGRYIGGDLMIHTESEGFTKRTIFSGWDVFRSLFPLYTIMLPRVVEDEINSLVTLANESGNGYFERWEFLNAYSGCMLGNPAISILTDAYMKGLRHYDIEAAYRVAKATSAQFGNGERGYTSGGSSISCTLEYAYTDWCIARLAEALGHTRDAQIFDEKTQAYRNIFDSEMGWFRVKNDDGTWAEWPDGGRTAHWYGCMECNPLQQGWFVPHDVAGMTALMGGREKTVADLNDMFEKTPREMYWNDYYNHANEPVHAVPFLFNRLGSPWLTQKWTRFICDNAYANAVEGLIGNEDVGQMSAWYILAAAGIHPYCPGDTRFEITSPVFDKITFRLDSTYFSGGEFTIITHGNSDENIYIRKARLNGKSYNKCHIDFADITRGGTLELFMSDKPNTKFGKQ
ncbi:MAG: GH92 family glycosyl hydrolase [Coprobacter sp.]|nr:GH92 family glycosyl hydrolase [Coprobacter sp.]